MINFSVFSGELHRCRSAAHLCRLIGASLFRYLHRIFPLVAVLNNTALSQGMLYSKGKQQRCGSAAHLCRLISASLVLPHIGNNFPYSVFNYIAERSFIQERAMKALIRCTCAQTDRRLSVSLSGCNIFY